ncbi:UDP-N-acetylglucosamine--LPS N-acetylglucosamine transferase [Endozoicomonas sp. ALD040]|uniref:UDP-N-acetylglucosamine--LPS N-acetylglucosamine transferase n=1 Tax=unclassified Endozoicomonas TaxID=2644528 RepID=UPI003BB1F7FB
MKKILAVASGGGHWKQLIKLKPELEKANIIYATTIKGLAEQEGIKNSYILPEASSTEKLKIPNLLYEVIKMIVKERPDIIISTGAAPGLLTIVCGRLLGSKTLWIDSIANGEKLSMCGRLSTFFAHKTLSQWENLCDGRKVFYHGSII